MKKNNVRKWVKALRSGRYKQANGVLARVDDKTGKKSYCCLGVGCVTMGLRGYRDQGSDALKYKGFESLPPKQFHDWLGVSLLNDAKEGDVFLDIPRPRHPGNHRPVKEWLDRNGHWLEDACATLNDTLEMPFDQIADMVDYFGVRDERPV